MPLDVRKVSVNFAVIFFFSLSVVMILSGLPLFTCCKRAIMGAVVVYIVAGIGVKLINLILIDAMMTQQLEQNESSGIANKSKERGTK